jgi:hypothetical protein
MRYVISVLVAVLVAPPAYGQSSAASSDAQTDRTAIPAAVAAAARSQSAVAVATTGEPGLIRGQLMDASSSRLVIRVPDPSRVGFGATVTVEVPMTLVRHVDSEKRDSVLNGAIVGALFLAACARWWCQQGLDSSEPLGIDDIIIGVGIGAAVGASIDGAIHSPRRIYTAPAPAQRSALSTGFQYRFRF